MTRRSDAGEARNRGPSRVRSVWIQNAVKANALEPGLAGDQIWPGTGPDFLAKHRAATHWVATTSAIIKKLL